MSLEENISHCFREYPKMKIRIEILETENQWLQAEVARLKHCLAMMDRSDAYKRYQDEITIQNARIAELETSIKRLLSHADDEYYGQAAAEAKALLGEGK